MELTFYGQNIWGNMSEEERISNRNAGVKAMILAYDADICCFQECNPGSSRSGEQAIEKLLADAYEEVPTPAGKNNFTPVFYRRDRFRVMESGFILFEGRNDGDSKSITWAVMEEMESGVRFGICSTHFWWKAECEEDNLQRLENAAVLWKQVEEMRMRYQIPVFVTGDLNCGKDALQGDEPYQWLKERLLDARLYAEKTTDAYTLHPYPRRDANRIYHASFGEPEAIIDHFFVSRHPKVRLKSFVVDNSAVALSTSDHSPLIVRAEIYS